MSDRLAKLVTLSTAVVLAFPLVACGGGEPAASRSGVDGTGPLKPAPGVDLSGKTFADLSGETDVSVQARDNAFVQPYIQVKAGTTITFVNRGRNQHDVFAATDGAFAPIEAADFDPKETASRTFDEPGDYPYYCTLHGTPTKGMVGAVRVVK